MKTYNIKEDRYFTILGSIALKEDGLKRIPSNELKQLELVNPRAAFLSHNTAGMQVRFKTNSKKISVKVKLKGLSDMNNMSSLGQSGVDIYVYHKELKEYVFQKATPYERHLLEYEYDLINNVKGEFYEYILNLPLYNSVHEVFLVLDEDAVIIPFTKNDNNNIVFYGTSIVQGGTVSRAGLLYSNMISRKLDNEIFNFGFSGVAFLEKEMAHILTKVENPKILIIDAQPNAGVDFRLRDNLEGFIEEFRKVHKDTKILVCSRISYALDLMDEAVIKQNQFNRNFMENLVNKLRVNDKNIFYVDGYEVFGDHFYEYTVDGIHPNDLGAKKLANFYLDQILKHLD